MTGPSNPYQKDAEACGKLALAFIRESHKAYRCCDLDVIAGIARWAAHWGALALKHRG